MKWFGVPLFMAILCSLFFPAASFAGESRGVTILYTGAVAGNIEPCAA